MSSSSLGLLGLSTDTWTLVLGLVVFAALRYYVRRHVKTALIVTPPSTIGTKGVPALPTKPSRNLEPDIKDSVETAETQNSCGKADCCRSAASADKDDGPLVILYGTTTGTARQLGGELAARLGGGDVTLRDCADFGKNIDEEFAAYAKSRARLVSVDLRLKQNLKKSVFLQLFRWCGDTYGTVPIRLFLHRQLTVSKT